MNFDRHALDLDTAATAGRIESWIRHQVRHELSRSGIVVGLSGGIDSAVVAALSARAIGPERVLGVALPEHESESESAALAAEVADALGIELVTQEISPGLDGMGCYRHRDEAIRRVFPEYGEGWTAKITNPGSILEKEGFNVFRLTVADPEGRPHTARLPLDAYLQIVAASNLKQRLRMSALYYHAESRNRVVAGTANRDELGQGFFVKYGDGGADLHPIMRLFKIQVFQLAGAIGVPQSIIERTPTTDTYSADVSQEEFYYGLDFETMDLLTWAMEQGLDADPVARALDLEPAQVRRAWSNIFRKRMATTYLRATPLAVVGSEEDTPIDPVLAAPEPVGREG